jgi:hypothetical protein
MSTRRPSRAASAAATDDDMLSAEVTSENDVRESEPEPESATSTVGDVDTTVTKISDKVDLKNVKCETFDGSVKDGQFDSGVRDWWDQFADQIEYAQILAGQHWSDSVKTAALSLFLTGMARRWLKRHTTITPNTTFDEIGASLISKFKSNLSDQEITQKIYNETKRPTETYREYADRLLQMVGALEGGTLRPANARHALSTFVRLAWFKKRDALQARIDTKSDDPVHEIDRAVDVLSELAASDGRYVQSKRRKDNDGRVVKLSKQAATANAATVERKRKPATQSRGGTITCYICREPGHTAKYHNKHLKKSNDNEKNQTRTSQLRVDERRRR